MMRNAMIGSVVAAAIFCCLASAGCARLLKQDMALKEAIRQGRIQGVKARDIPWGQVKNATQADAGEFSDADILNVHISMPDYSAQSWSVVFGRSRADGKWKIVRVAQRQAVRPWMPLPVLPDESVSAADSTGEWAADEQGGLVKAAIVEGRILTIMPQDRQGTMVRWSWPEPHRGEFSEVDIRNYDIRKSNGALEYWSVVLGQPRNSDVWKVVRVSKRLSENEWRDLLVPQEQSLDESAGKW